MDSENYAVVLKGIKERVRFARQQLVFTINSDLIKIYYEIGKTLIQYRAEKGWGAKLIDQLAKDLRREFPDMRGFSVRNLKYMQRFAQVWSDVKFMQHPIKSSQSIGSQSDIFVQQLVAQIPWGHHIVLLDKLKTRDEREFYLKGIVENKWSRAVLLRQIDTNLYTRKGMAITNFSDTLPREVSDLARETLNNPYILEFTGLTEQVQEQELEKALTNHMQKFLLELGRGFAFVGRQTNIVVNGDEFFLDLLFYNWLLNCFVVFELKVGDFQPEFAGKLNFYVNTVNKQFKQRNHKPTIGVLLCRTPNDTVIRYSLSNIDSPIGVSDYELVKSLPKELKTEIPTVEELEAEIEKELNEFRTPVEKKLDVLKKVAKMKTKQ